jgi:hypothetical protein
LLHIGIHYFKPGSLVAYRRPLFQAGRPYCKSGAVILRPFDMHVCREYSEYYRKEEFPMGDSKSQNNFEEKDRLNEQQRREQEAMKDKAREPNEQNRMINTADNQRK